MEQDRFLERTVDRKKKKCGVYCKRERNECKDKVQVVQWSNCNGKVK